MASNHADFADEATLPYAQEALGGFIMAWTAHEADNSLRIVVESLHMPLYLYRVARAMTLVGAIVTKVGPRPPSAANAA